MANRRDYFDSFCRISRAFATAEKKDVLLSRIVESAKEAVDAKAAGFFIQDRDSDTFVPSAITGLSANYLQGPFKGAAEKIDILKETGVILIKDAATDERTAGDKAKQSEGIASILIVPVKTNNRIIGVLSVYTAVPRDFSEDDIRFITALAQQGGTAIERAGLINQLHLNARLFRDISAAINASLDVAAIMRVLTEELAKGLRAKGGSIRLIDEKTDKLRLMASYGVSDAYLNKGEVADDKGIVEAMNGKTVVISDVANAEGIKFRDEKKAEGIVTILTVPICVKHSVIGVFRIYFGSSKRFYEDEIMTVEALGHLGGLAIQNTSCYMRLESDMKGAAGERWNYRSWF